MLCFQENPFRASAVNDGYLQSSGSEMDRDVSEIEIETAVVPYDEEDFGYPSGRPLYINSQHKTFRGKALRKHSYSNILKILRPKKENFQIKKIPIFFIFLLKT